MPISKPKRLTDPVLFGHVLAYKAHKADESAAKQRAETERDIVCAELKARKVDEWEHDGLKVTMRTTRKVLSIERARALLTRTVLRRVTKTVLDPPMWDVEKAAGHITDADDDHCRVDQPVAAHIYVSQVGQRKIAA